MHLYSPTTMKALGTDCKFRRVGLTHTENCPNNVNAISISTNKMFICIHWCLFELPQSRPQWPHAVAHKCLCTSLYKCMLIKKSNTGSHQMVLIILHSMRPYGGFTNSRVWSVICGEKLHGPCGCGVPIAAKWPVGQWIEGIQV